MNMMTRVRIWRSVDKNFDRGFVALGVVAQSAGQNAISTTPGFG